MASCPHCLQPLHPLQLNLTGEQLHTITLAALTINMECRGHMENALTTICSEWMATQRTQGICRHVLRTEPDGTVTCVRCNRIGDLVDGMIRWRQVEPA